MSQGNYGERDFQIRIPIEIVPDIKDIQKGIRELQRRPRRDSSKLSTQINWLEGNYTPLSTHRAPTNTGFTKWSLRGTALPPIGGEAPFNRVEDNKRDQEQKRMSREFAKGVIPTEYRLGYAQPKLVGTGNVPVGAGSPRDIAEANFKFRANREVGLGIYQTNPAPENALSSLFSRALGGPGKAATAISLLRNPLGIIRMLSANPATGPLLAGLIAVGVAKVIIKDMVRKGSIFDRTFKNVVFNRFEIFRTREQQQRILVGFGDTAQLITTTTAGTTSPRDSYNTYEVINRDYKEVAENFAIRDNRGYGP